MTTAPGAAIAEKAAAVRDSIDDVRRQAVADLGRAAHRLESRARHAAEDGADAARRAMRKATRRAVDARDDISYRIKRQPLGAVGLAFGLGALIGLVVGWGPHGRRDRHT
jgi:ElaB/YqjD/DUF883 family membrane-anchored ribosome-binding protein